MIGRHNAQAAVEFALTMPLLMLLLLGILDAGRAVVAAVSIDNAAREGARYIAVHFNDGTCASPNCQTEARQVVLNSALALDSGQLTSTVTIAGGSASILLSYPFQPVAPLITSVFGTPVLTTTSSMRIR